MEENINAEEIVDTNVVEELPNTELPTEETPPVEETPPSEPILPDEPSQEQLDFEARMAEIDELNLEKDDIVILRNGDIGRIDAISKNEEERQFRIYVKITDNLLITIDDNFKSISNGLIYDVGKIISKDFTNTKLEVALTETIITKEEAEDELSTIKGETVIIK